MSSYSLSDALEQRDSQYRSGTKNLLFLRLILVLMVLLEGGGLLFDWATCMIDNNAACFFSDGFINLGIMVVGLIFLISTIWIPARPLVAYFIIMNLFFAVTKAFVSGGDLHGVMHFYLLIPVLAGLYYYNWRGTVLVIVTGFAGLASVYLLQKSLVFVPAIIRRPDPLTFNFMVVSAEMATVLLLVCYLVIESRLALRQLARKEKHTAEEAKAKDRFMARVSHELRTPLISLVGFAEMLQQESEDTHESIREGIYLSSLNLLTMINNLLDLNKISQGQFQMRPVRVDLTKMYQDTRKMFQPSLKSQRLTMDLKLDPNPLPAVMVDPMCIERLLVNLVGNAIKYTTDGVVTVEFALHAGMLEVVVTDTGSGMSEEDVRRVFEPYYRSREQAAEGTGLGLALVKELVERAGGRIDLFSTPGRGTRVRASLPVVEAESAGSRAGPTAASSSKKPFVRPEQRPASPAPVLFVEDQEDIRTMIELFVENLGYEATICSSWDEVQAIDLDPVSAAFVDLRLPGVDGYQICERLLQSKPQIKVYAMTAQAPDGGEPELLQHGFSGLLLKPFTLSQLSELIRENLPQ